MNIKKRQERADVEEDIGSSELAYGVEYYMQAEIDELRAALAERDVEIGDLPQAQADMLATIKAQRVVLEQSLEALLHAPWKNWRTDKAITAIQEQLK